MDRGSSSEDDSDDDVPLTVSLGVARPKSVLVGSSLAKSAKRPLVAPSAAPAPKKAKPAAKPVPKPAAKPAPKPAAKPAPKPTPKPAAKPPAKSPPKPSPKTASSTSDLSSSEEEEDDLSDDDEDTSSEEDEDSDNESVPAPPPVPAPAPAPAIPVGILVSSPARTAVERLNAALQALDASSAPLEAQVSIEKSKTFIPSGASDAMQKLCDGSPLTDAHVSCLLQAMSLAALQLTNVAAASSGGVDREVQSFRRAAHQMHVMWDNTLPQIEALADAARKQQDASAHAARIAAELLGTHTTMANTVANVLEDMKRRR